MKAVTLLLPVTLAAIACSPAPESADIVIIGGGPVALAASRPTQRRR